MFEIDNLRKIYKAKSNIKIEALKSVSFKMPDKGMLFIIGENGSGKSSLVKCLSLQDEDYEGTIKYKNKDIKLFDKDEKNYFLSSEISVVNQELDLLYELTVRKSLELVCNINSTYYDSQLFNDVLKEVNLDNHIDSKVNTLSVGERQRVIIAMCLIKRSRIIILDEPTSSLDDKNSQEIISILKKNSEKKLIIIISHNSKIVDQYADFIIRLKKGQIIESNLIESNINMIYSSKKNKSLKTSFILELAFTMFKKRSLKLVLYGILIITFFLLFFLLLFFTNFSMRKISDKYYEKTKNSFVSVYSDMNDTIGIDGEIPIYNASINLEYYKEEYSNAYYVNEVKNVSVIDESIRSNLKLKILAGKLPINDNEILITDYHFNVFNDLGLLTRKVDEYYIYDDIVGENLEIDGNLYIITGVLNSNIDNYTYKNISKESFNKQSILYFELAEILNTSIANVFFVSQSGIDNMSDKDIVNYNQVNFSIIPISTNADKSKISSYIIESKEVHFGDLIKAYTDYNIYEFEFLYKYKDKILLIIIFLVFLICSLFTSEVIILRKNEIRLLRNYGVKYSDLCKLYVLEGVFFSLYIYIVNLFVFIASTFILEQILINVFGYSLIGYSLNLKMFIYPLIISSSSSFLTTLSLFYYYKDK